MRARKWPHSSLPRCSIVEHYRPPHCEVIGRASSFPSKMGMRKNDGRIHGK